MAEDFNWVLSAHHYRSFISNSSFYEIEEGDYEALENLLPRNEDSIYNLKERCEIIALYSAFSTFLEELKKLDPAITQAKVILYLFESGRRNWAVKNIPSFQSPISDEIHSLVAQWVSDAYEGFLDRKEEADRYRYSRRQAERDSFDALTDGQMGDFDDSSLDAAMDYMGY